MNVNKLSSRKLWVTVASAAVISLADQLGLDKNQVEELVKVCVAYLIAQGVGDTVKTHKGK